MQTIFIRRDNVVVQVYLLKYLNINYDYGRSFIIFCNLYYNFIKHNIIILTQITHVTYIIIQRMFFVKGPVSLGLSKSSLVRTEQRDTYNYNIAFYQFQALKHAASLLHVHTRKGFPINFPERDIKTFSPLSKLNTV